MDVNNNCNDGNYDSTVDGWYINVHVTQNHVLPICLQSLI